MKYYEMHEMVYQRLQNDGVLSWDKSTTFEEMWSHSTNLYLDKYLTRTGQSFSGKRILDLGTGTGTSALFAAKNGAEAVGVEISSSAIDIAHSNAKKLGLTAEFIQGDVLNLDLGRTFDVVIDSTILHCIVGAQDRKNFYDSVKRHMHDRSYFFVNTMIATEDMSSRFPKEYFYFQDDVLWSLGISEISERKEIKGGSYFPHRTLLSREKQLQEFSEHGFDIVEVENNVGSNGGFDLVALLKLS